MQTVIMKIFAVILKVKSHDFEKFAKIIRNLCKELKLGRRIFTIAKVY